MSMADGGWLMAVKNTACITTDYKCWTVKGIVQLSSFWKQPTIQNEETLSEIDTPPEKMPQV